MKPRRGGKQTQRPRWRNSLSDFLSQHFARHEYQTTDILELLTFFSRCKAFVSPPAHCSISLQVQSHFSIWHAKHNPLSSSPILPCFTCPCVLISRLHPRHVMSAQSEEGGLSSDTWHFGPFQRIESVHKQLLRYVREIFIFLRKSFLR